MVVVPETAAQIAPLSHHARFAHQVPTFSSRVTRPFRLPRTYSATVLIRRPSAAIAVVVRPSIRNGHAENWVLEGVTELERGFDTSLFPVMLTSCHDSGFALEPKRLRYHASRTLFSNPFSGRWPSRPSVSCVHLRWTPVERRKLSREPLCERSPPKPSITRLRLNAAHVNPLTLAKTAIRVTDPKTLGHMFTFESDTLFKPQTTAESAISAAAPKSFGHMFTFERTTR